MTPFSIWRVQLLNHASFDPNILTFQVFQRSICLCARCFFFWGWYFSQWNLSVKSWFIVTLWDSIPVFLQEGTKKPLDGDETPFTLPPIIMEVGNGSGPQDEFFLYNRFIFHWTMIMGGRVSCLNFVSEIGWTYPTCIHPPMESWDSTDVSLSMAFSSSEFPFSGRKI